MITLKEAIDCELMNPLEWGLINTVELRYLKQEEKETIISIRYYSKLKEEYI